MTGQYTFRRQGLLVAALFLGGVAAAGAATFTVTTTADSGPGSLRQALLDAYEAPGSSIHFAIGSGVQTIRPLTELPVIANGLIDGTTQPGYAGSPLIQIDGSLLPAQSAGITIGASINGAAEVTVRALAINNCFRGIFAHASVNVTGSFIGTDVTGSLARPNAIGIHLLGAEATSVIGGITVAQRNVISGNAAYGVLVGAGTVATIIGNFIGTNAAGNAALPNQDGVSIEYTSNVAVGGGASGWSNLISGNTQHGVSVFYSTDVAIQGNRIGPAHLGGAFAGVPQRVGIVVYQSSRARIGGGEPGEGNVIAHHGYAAIGVQPVSNRIAISGNSIHSNAFGIDLDYELNQSGSRVTPNDEDDPDVGPNLLQNFPVITSVEPVGSSTTIRGTLNSSASSSFRIEFFSNASCNGSGHGEGRTYLGFIDATTDASGDASFEANLPVGVLPTEVVTATATDEFGNTSEFSACKSVGLKFFTLDQCRVLDTRNPVGPLGGPALLALASRLVALANACGVPTTAVSVSVNIAVTEATAAGHLTFHPPETGAPVASNINFTAGKTRANSAILRVSSDGSGSVVVVNGSPGTVHVILDVNGYFQ